MLKRLLKNKENENIKEEYIKVSTLNRAPEDNNTACVVDVRVKNEHSFIMMMLSLFRCLKRDGLEKKSLEYLLDTAFDMQTGKDCMEMEVDTNGLK